LEAAEQSDMSLNVPSRKESLHSSNTSAPENALGNSFGVYLGEAHTADPFAPDVQSTEQSVFFGVEDKGSL